MSGMLGPSECIEEIQRQFALGLKSEVSEVRRVKFNDALASCNTFLNFWPDDPRAAVVGDCRDYVQTVLRRRS